MLRRFSLITTLFSFEDVHPKVETYIDTQQKRADVDLSYYTFVGAFVFLSLVRQRRMRVFVPACAEIGLSRGCAVLIFSLPSAACLLVLLRVEGISRG